MQPSGYALRNSPGGNSGRSVLASWVFEASADGGDNWECLDERNADESASGPGEVRVFGMAAGSEWYDMFRISQTGGAQCPQGQELTHVGLSGFEIYGCITRGKPPQQAAQMAWPTSDLTEVMRRPKQQPTDGVIFPCELDVVLERAMVKGVPLKTRHK